MQPIGAPLIGADLDGCRGDAAASSPRDPLSANHVDADLCGPYAAHMAGAVPGLVSMATRKSPLVATRSPRPRRFSDLADRPPALVLASFIR